MCHRFDCRPFHYHVTTLGELFKTCFCQLRSQSSYRVPDYTYLYTQVQHRAFNPLTGTLKPQSNGPLHSSTVIGTLVVDGWWVGCYIWYNEERPGRAAAPPSPLLAVPNVTVLSPPINDQCTNFILFDVAHTGAHYRVNVAVKTRTIRYCRDESEN